MLRLALASLLAIEVVYVLALNVFLNLGLLTRALDGAQKVIHLEYRFAFTPLPGLAFVRGLDLRGQDTQVEWQVTAERVFGAIELTGLFRKRFRLLAADVDGATFRLRARRQPEALCTREAEALPNIPGYFNAPEAGGRENRAACLAAAQEAPRVVKGPPPNPERLWRAELGRIRGRRLREVWIESYRLRADAEVRGGFELFPTQRLTVSPTGFSVRSGTVTSGQETIARGLELVGSVEVAKTDLTQTRGRALLDGVSVSSTLSATLASLGFLNDLLDAESVRFVGGKGGVSGRLEFARGGVLPGSRLRIEARALRAKVFDLTASALGTVRLEAEALPAGDRVDTRLLLSAQALKVSFRDFVLQGALSLRTRVQDTGPGARGLRIHGSRLELEDVMVVEADRGQVESVKWWGTVTVPRGVLTPGQETVFDGDVHVRLRDLRPLLAIFAAETPLPKVATPFLDAKDIEGDMTVQVGGAGAFIPAFHAQGEGLTVDAFLLKQRALIRGAIRLDLGLLKLMLARDATETRVVLFDTARAFEAERARLFTTGPSSPARPRP